MNYPAITKNSDNQNAIDVPVDTTAFNGRLSPSDIDVQKALETLNNHNHDDTYVKSSGGVSRLSSTGEVNSKVHQELELMTAGIAATVTNAVDGQKMIVTNRSNGNANFNHAIEFQGVVYPAPVTLPAGDSYNLTYDLGNAVWVAK